MDPVLDPKLRIQLFILMRILMKMIQICYHLSADLQESILSLHASIWRVHDPPWLQLEPLKSLHFVFNVDPYPQSCKLLLRLRIWIHNPASHYYVSTADPDPQPFKLLLSTYCGSRSALCKLQLRTADPDPQPNPASPAVLLGSANLQTTTE